MRAPRYAQCLSVAALAAGFLASGSARGGGTAAVDSAPTAAPEPEPEPESEPEPEFEPEPEPESEPEPDEAQTLEAGDEESVEPEGVDTPAVDGEGPPDPEGDEIPAADAEGPVDVASTEPEMIKVRAGAASSRSSVGKPILAAPSSETVVDRRRRHADERILLRASAVSFGVAGAALVPMIVGLQQGAKARRQLDEASPTDAERTSLERSERQMNRLALGSGLVAGVQLVTGAVLLGVFMQGKTPRRHTVAPTLGTGQVGLLWRARF